jgi:hypothetical protein
MFKIFNPVTAIEPYLSLVSTCLQKATGSNHVVLNPQSFIDNYSDINI